MRVALESDSEHAPDFPFVPVRRGPKVRGRVNGRLILLERHFDAEIFVPAKREEMIHDGEIAWRLPLAVHPHTLIDGGEVVQHAVRPGDIFLEETEGIVEILTRDPAGRDSIRCVLQLDGMFAKLTPQLADNTGGISHGLQTSSLSMCTIGSLLNISFRPQAESPQ